MYENWNYNIFLPNGLRLNVESGKTKKQKQISPLLKKRKKYKLFDIFPSFFPSLYHLVLLPVPTRTISRSNSLASNYWETHLLDYSNAVVFDVIANVLLAGDCLRAFLLVVS